MDALENMRALLKARGCTVRASGMREQWTYPSPRRAVLIINADKGALRLCAERICDYSGKVPASLIHAIERAPNCGGDCRPWGGRKCAGVWRFLMGGCECAKCRYGAFIFSLTQDDLGDVRDMLQMELDARATLSEHRLTLACAYIDSTTNYGRG